MVSYGRCMEKCPRIENKTLTKIKWITSENYLFLIHFQKIVQPPKGGVTVKNCMPLINHSPPKPQ